MDLYHDIVGMLHKLPPVDVVLGVPRSGMLPATMIATELGLPLGVAGGDFIGGGVRLTGSFSQKADRPLEGSRILLVDDTVNTGGSMRSSQAATGLPCITCSVYAASEGTVDFYGSILPFPRVFSWNLFHHVVLDETLVDMDGVLCLDPIPFDDDGYAYQNALINTVPLHRPKKVRGIVTNRIERWRGITEDWLAAHHISYEFLVMRPHATAALRRLDVSPGAYKATVYADSGATLFIESSDTQAAEIAQLSKKPVISVESYRLF